MNNGSSCPKCGCSVMGRAKFCAVDDMMVRVCSSCGWQKKTAPLDRAAATSQVDAIMQRVLGLRSDDR